MSETRVVPVIWSCAAMHDVSCRRGLWFTETTDPPNKQSEIIVVAGREGNDARFEIRVGDVMTQKKMNDLLECLGYARWMQDEYRGCDREPMEWPVMSKFKDENGEAISLDYVPQMIEGDGKQKKTLITIGPRYDKRSAKFVIRGNNN